MLLSITHSTYFTFRLISCGNNNNSFRVIKQNLECASIWRSLKYFRVCVIFLNNQQRRYRCMQELEFLLIKQQNKKKKISPEWGANKWVTNKNLSIAESLQGIWSFTDKAVNIIAYLIWYLWHMRKRSYKQNLECASIWRSLKYFRVCVIF